MDELLQTLAGVISKRQCVLFLGPGIFKANAQDELSVYEDFALSISQKLEKENKAYDKVQQKNIYYIIPKYIKAKNDGPFARTNIVDLRNDFAKFVEKKRLEDNPVFAQLSQLPFSIVVNSNPDDILYDLSKKRFKVKRTFYDISNKSSGENRQSPLMEEDFSENDMIIYNIFGCLENINSLLLEENELIDYVASIHHVNTQIPKILTDKLDGNKYYLFLGFNFELWHLKNVLKALGLPKGDRITVSVPMKPPPTYLQHFFEDQFKILFVQEDNIGGLVNDLYDLYQKEYNVSAKIKKTPDRKIRIVFINHQKDPVDLLMKEKICQHLKPAAQDGLIVMWSEEMITGGEDRRASLTENLLFADIIVPLISGEFVSDYYEYLQLIENVYAERGKKPVIVPVLTKAYNYPAINFLKTFQWLPGKNGEVTALSSLNDQDEAFKNIGTFITKEVDKILEQV